MTGLRPGVGRARVAPMAGKDKARAKDRKAVRIEHLDLQRAELRDVDASGLVVDDARIAGASLRDVDVSGLVLDDADASRPSSPT